MRIEVSDGGAWAVWRVAGLVMVLCLGAVGGTLQTRRIRKGSRRCSKDTPLHPWPGFAFPP